MIDFELRAASLRDLNDLILLEALGFTAGERESSDVYAERIRIFPNGSLMVTKRDQCIGCFFSEIWQRKEAIRKIDFELGHDISQIHDAELGTELYISSMTIHPDFRGSGRGRLLLDRGVETVVNSNPNVKSVVLLVSEEWLPARKTYQQSGFNEIAVFEKFFSPAVNTLFDGIVMRKELQK